MAIMVSLWSKKKGEIKSFLESYYKKKINMDSDVEQWMYIYNKPLDAIDIISALVDNNEKFGISMCLQIDKGDIYPITVENGNDIIKGIFCLFYKEPDECTYL